MGRYHIEMRGTQITSQKGAFVCWTPHLSQSVEMDLNRERLLVSNDISYIHVGSTIQTGQNISPVGENFKHVSTSDDINYTLDTSV